MQLIVTLGPSTSSEADLYKIKDKGVDFVRINMSHSSIEDLKHFIKMAKKVGLPFIIDTEGSQVRTGNLEPGTIELEESEEIKLYSEEIAGSKTGFSLKPADIIGQLSIGDLIHIDFDGVTLRVSGTSTLQDGFITAKVVTSGTLGKNKAVVIDTVSGKRINPPTLSEKDYQSIQVGLEEGIGHIAASFMRSGKAVDEVRRATQNTMKIISKIECVDALENLDEIIRKSDYLLIDRGDLSKEIPIEKIPFTQKLIINRARKYGTGVFVATNLLETMIEKRKPTRAEVHDVINTIADGACGLTLAAETAVGKYPLACINMMNNLIKHARLVKVEEYSDKENLFLKKLTETNYLLDSNLYSALVPPHGGKLVDRMLKEKPSPDYLNKLQKVVLDDSRQRDVEQIALGTYSPLEGFMTKEDLQSVLDRTRLANGLVWPLPIILDVSEEKAEELEIGKEVALTAEGEVMALLHLEEKYRFDLGEMASKLYSTTREDHPGVKMVKGMQPVFLAGKISLLNRMPSEFKEYELTPRQARKLFEERGWAKVIGFHTRNVIHRSHEFIQMEALRRENCDGLFVHPVVGKKKPGDFNAKYIIQSYELMNKLFYPKGKVIFGTFSTYSRYAGPREALFTALCRKNFGCSHFIVGRDHTGVGNFYHPKASHNVFDRFPDLGIVPVRFDQVFYSRKAGSHLHEPDHPQHPEDDKIQISGTEARKTLENGELPPAWFMRPEVSRIILEALKRGEEVFVKN